MKTHRKISNRFRELLKQELQIWQTDGIISAEQSSSLSQKYRLDQMARESTNRLLFAIYIIGAVLVGAGIISFVAAHWNEITPFVKIGLIVACMLTVHIAGFYLWKISGKNPRLGHALVVLGTLVFGANIGLMAQIFHIKSNFYNGLFAWAIGAIIMAYAVKSVPNAVIAILVSFIGFCGWAADNHLSFCYYPFIAALIFLPFAYFRQSVLTYTLSLVFVGASVLVCVAAVCSYGSYTEFSAFYLTGAGLGLLYFGYGLLSDRTSAFRSFALPAMVLGVVIMALTAYTLSFRNVAMHIQWVPSDAWHYSVNRGSTRYSDMLRNWWRWGSPAIATYLVAVIIWGWLILRRGLSDYRFRFLSISVFVASVLTISGVIVAAMLPHFSERYDNCVLKNHLWIVVVLFNLGCFALCTGMIAGSFQTVSRGLFWAGVLFTALIITSRFLEYETGLLIKAAVFIACGICLILAGVGFENYLKQRRPANA